MNADGESIRARREALGVSIQDLARLAGIGRDTLSDMESGRKDFRRLTLAKADKALRALEVEKVGAPSHTADADRIPERRGALGLSQAALADEAGVNRDTVGAIESGLGFRPSSLRKIEAALDRLEEEAGIAETSRRDAGARIQERRVALGVTVKTLAEGARVDRGRLSAIEDGASARPSTFGAIEAELTRLEADEGAYSSPARDLIEFELSDPFGLRLVVKGPSSEADTLKRQVLDIIREIRVMREPSAP